MMAPIHRSARLVGQVAYAMVYGLIHTAAIFLVLVLFFPQLDLSQANPGTIALFMALGSFSFVGGIGILAAILPLLYVERGAQMTFVVQSSLLPSAASTTPSTSCRAGCRSCPTCRRRPTCWTGFEPGSRRGCP